MKKLSEDKDLVKRWEDSLPFSDWMTKGMDLQYQVSQNELTKLTSQVDQLWKPKHHNQCYGIDIEPHPECIYCKWIAIKRQLDKR